MTIVGWTQIGLYLIVLLVLAKPLGIYIARVYMKAPCGLERLLGPVEGCVYRICGISSEEEMSWWLYAKAVLLFSFAGMTLLFFVQLFQAQLPLNPQGFQAIPFDSAFNTAASFVSNTNWQSYRGESTLSYLVQMLGLTVQNFLSAATGMAVLVALIRGLVRRESSTVGNFWQDLTRTILYILLPLSLLLSMVLVSQGVIQNLGPYQTVSLLQATQGLDGNNVASQILPMGPVASQVAIKQLGTNGGGFFGANSAHPFENPTPLANFLEMLAILLIPAALCHTFGRMVGDSRQGWALLTAMLLIFLPLLWLSYAGESHGNPYLGKPGIDQSAGNMEGKEVRFGVANSVLWATATTAASNGSVNAMHDSLSPLSGMASLWLIQLGEIVFGGVGSGLYGMLVFVIVAVFVAGLMVGRTPEYLGKKIEPFEMKMATLVILIPATLVLIGTAVACMCDAGITAVANPGPHGFTEILYAFSSAGNNNGSAFAGLSADSPFYNLTLGFAMLVGRFGIIVPVLAMAGSLAAKKRIPAGTGTLPTTTPLFVLFLVGVIVLVGALTFLPALALGPLAEWLLSPG
ncbi:MAG: potassium-transporting ATPase subunit KdpA [Desulfuromonadales bacterium]|nr:potassium-transporting ATPase subunit KdpA [Desulfuromonadales bacterium]